ncbi:MAG: nitrile hydratase subunit beta [Candidatus Binataceae bacterium]
MNGVHDLGGMDGFGTIVREESEPVFHAGWERRTFALAVSAMRARHFNVDEFRRAIERMPPVQYLASTYYERWLYALEALLVEKGVIGRGEMAAAIAKPDTNVANVPDPSGAVAAAMLAESAGTPSPSAGKGAARGRADSTTTASTPEAPNGRGVALRYDSSFKPRFKDGDHVIARNLNPAGHTRLPRYVRGRHGVIYRDWGVFVFPDTHAHGRGTNPQHCYGVAFTARELWGEDHRGGETIYIDLWEDYLAPARAAVPQASAKPQAGSKKPAAARKAAKPDAARIAQAVKSARPDARAKASGRTSARTGKASSTKKPRAPLAKKPAARMAKKSITKPARKTVKKK